MKINIEISENDLKEFDQYNNFLNERKDGDIYKRRTQLEKAFENCHGEILYRVERREGK